MAHGDARPHSDVDLLAEAGPDPSPWFPGGLGAAWRTSWVAQYRLSPSEASLMDSSLEVRPFAGRQEYEQMVDYFLDADDKFLQGMGVDRSRLPPREDWISSALRDHDRPNCEKERAYVAWSLDGVAIGHSSINRIQMGREAFIHLHLWSRVHRRAGLGIRFFQLSVGQFARDFSLERLYCEPSAENPGPNRVLQV